MRARGARSGVKPAASGGDAAPPIDRGSTGSVASRATLVGSSAAMVRLRAQIARVAASDRAVLIHGPTGSGKELVARAIHALGSRRDAPLIELNCCAVPDSLLEAELFGWERGAFTGADRRSEGLLAAAGDGTLFLDEIGDLPLSLQSKLLRALESRRFRPLGSTDERECAARIVSATNADLRGEVAAGRFREDLYHRLSVLVLGVPSLDERRDDIPELARHFAHQQTRSLHFTGEALDALAGAPWPGNVRQLRNAVDRLAVFADDCVIRRDTIEGLLRDIVRADPAGEMAAIRTLARTVLASGVPDKLAAMKEILVEEALSRAAGNRSEAARLLGVDRKLVARRLLPR